MRTAPHCIVMCIKTIQENLIGTFATLPHIQYDTHAATSPQIPYIRLQLRWHHQFQFAGYYAAIEKGYYHDAGLEVALLEGGGEKNVIDEVLNGHADYGVTNSELLLHRLQGKPLVVLAAIFQHSPLVLLSRAETGISTPQDLPGKKIKMSRGSREVELHAMLSNEGISLDSLNLIEGFTSYDNYFDPDIDVLAAYSTNQPYYLREKNSEYTLIRPSTYGVDFYGDCLFTSEDEVKNNPERIRAFRQATLQGWEYALAHPEEIVDLILSRYHSKKSKEHLLYEAAEIKKLILPDFVAIGHMNPGRWQNIADTSHRFNLVAADYSLDGFLYIPDLQNNLSKLRNILILLLFTLLVISIITVTLLLFNRRLQKEIKKRIETEITLQQKEQMLLNYSRQTEQFSLSAAAMLSIQDENKLFREISNAIIKHSDYSRVLISLFKNSPPYRELIGYAGVSGDIIKKVRDTDLSKDWYNNVFSLGLKIGQFSYYVPHNLKHILNQDAIIYGEGEVSSGENENQWHPLDNLFVRMNDESGKFLGIISVDTSKSGKRPTEETVRPLEIYASLISQIIILKREYNRRTLLEQHLRQSQKMEAIGNLTGGIAHDFNNILSVIIGNAELALLDTPEWTPASHNVQEIKVASLRAKEIVKQLLTFSKKSDSDLRSVVLEEIIEDGLKLLRSTLPANIELVSDLNLNSCIIEADPPLIYQMLLNLFSNAVHAMETDGGKLTIRGFVEIIDNMQLHQPDLNPGPYAVLSISDNGIGMTKDQLAHVFDPYYTTKAIGKGSGLGLSIVHGIIQSHNGDISVESEPGKGSTFTLSFPCVAGNVKQDQQRETAPLPGTQKTIMLVDDDTALLEVSTRILEKSGYAVMPLASPHDALILFKKDPDQYDLIVTDMTMPQCSGMEFAKEILDIRPAIPIFLCTGYNEKIDEQTAVQNGITRYFTKPLDSKELIDAIRQVLDGKGR